MEMMGEVDIHSHPHPFSPLLYRLLLCGVSSCIELNLVVCRSRRSHVPPGLKTFLPTPPTPTQAQAPTRDDEVPNTEKGECATSGGGWRRNDVWRRAGGVRPGELHPPLLPPDLDCFALEWRLGPPSPSRSPPRVTGRRRGRRRLLSMGTS